MTPPRHIVAVAGLVRNAEGRALMLLSPRRDWEFPGGQVEAEETLGRIIRPVIRDRMRDMLDFTGEVVYRAYEFDASKVYTEYVVHREQTL